MCVVFRKKNHCSLFPNSSDNVCMAYALTVFEFAQYLNSLFKGWAKISTGEFDFETIF